MIDIKTKSKKHRTHNFYVLLQTGSFHTFKGESITQECLINWSLEKVFAGCEREDGYLLCKHFVMKYFINVYV